MTPLVLVGTPFTSACHKTAALSVSYPVSYFSCHKGLLKHSKLFNIRLPNDATRRLCPGVICYVLLDVDFSVAADYSSMSVKQAI